jgi:hypothetical protein
MTLPRNDELLSAIRDLLGPGALPGASVGDKGYDLYEAFLFGLVVRAARRVFGPAAVWYETPGTGRTADVRRLRTSPGPLHNSDLHGYTHAVIEVGDGRRLEVHLGVYLAGASNVPHEADIAVIEEREAQRARSDRVDPRSKHALFAIEAKYYASALPISVGREYLGLYHDLTAKHRMLVSSTSAARVMTLLAARLPVGAFRPYVLPGGQVHEGAELEAWIATALRAYRNR